MSLAKWQVTSLNRRLKDYAYPLEEWVLQSTRESILKAEQRNKEQPWRFELPQPSQKSDQEKVTSTTDESPESNDSSQGDSSVTFQEQLRSSDNLRWLNTEGEQSLSFNDHLKGKFIVVDFWTSCCINCIHVLAELEELENKFKNFPEIAFIGVHSAKFDQEEALHILRQAVIRYDVKHACLNDCKFDVWNSLKLNNWPTIMIVGPDQNIIAKYTEERNAEVIEHMLFSALQLHSEKLQKSIAAGKAPEMLLSSTHLPMKLEKDKAAEYRRLQSEQGMADGAQMFASPEQIAALRQNLSQPGKLIYIDSAQSPTLTGQTQSVPLPYEGVTSLLVIADSSNNRLIVVDADTHRYLEQVGSGKNGYQEGSFAEAKFSLPQGMSHFIDFNGNHCLLVCDVKNHLVRQVNLNTKLVTHVAGVPRVRGRDTIGGEKPLDQQELVSPWDIVLEPSSGEFIIAMAGSHQIWRLNISSSPRCYRSSGSGAEGNQNSGPEESTWAQPSGLTLGPFNGEMSVFVADSESSAVRALGLESQLASNVAGANDDASDLFNFGDCDGEGYEAKLQHPIGLHFCEANSTLYVADTYNHKVKVLRQQNDRLLSTYLGDAHEALVRDGHPSIARLNEPNGCFAKTKVLSDGSIKYLGLYIADTGNDCVRFAREDGHVETVELAGVPDVRLTASECVGRQCDSATLFGIDSSDEEESKGQ